MSQPPRRLLFTGPFHADHRARALDALTGRADAGARDILYIVASGTARRTAVADLVARRRAVFGLRVRTLRSLPAELARRARTTEPKAIDGVIDELLVEREIRVASGNRFAASTPVQGLTSKARSTIDLLERNGATPELLAEFLKAERHGDGARVLAHAWRPLAARRARYGSSNAGRLWWAESLLHDHPAILAGLDLLVIEDLSLLTAVELSLVRALVGAAPAEVIAVHGYAPQLPNAPSTRSLVRLRQVAEWEETACTAPSFVGRVFASVIPSGARDLAYDARGKNGRHDGRVGPSLTLGMTLSPTLGMTNITLLESAGDLGEVRLAARVVRRHLDAGVPPENIALVVHANASRYRELAREVFGAAGIPVGISLPRTLADSGLGAMLLELLELAILPAGMTREASLAIARSPHSNLRANENDRLESRIIARGYLGIDGWDALALEALGERATNRVNRLKRAVADAHEAFASVSSALGAATVARQLAKDLRLVTNSYFSRRRLARGRGGDGALETRGALAVREDNQAWEEITAALDDTVPAMLDIEAKAASQTGLAFAESWLAQLTRVLQSATVTPDRVPAHAVQFRGTGPGSNAPATVTIVLGLLEKRFPRQARQDPFLGDEIRAALQARFAWELPTSAECIERERECFLRAVSSATEALYLSYSSIDSEGRVAARSFFIDDLEAAIGDGHPIPIECSGPTTAIPRVGDAVTGSDLFAAVSHDIWQYLPRDDETQARRGRAFRTLEALGRRAAVDLAVVRHGRRVTQHPVLEGLLPVSAPHLTLALSASQLNTLSHCTYAHFVAKVLTPGAIAAPEYNALSKGDFIHDAMMEWATTLRGWQRGEAALPELDTWMRAQIARWPAAKRGSERAVRTAGADIARLDELLRTELASLTQAGIAQPTYAELAFGKTRVDHGPRDPASRADAFRMAVPTTTRGTVTVMFRGSVDRVDVVTIGNERYAVVIDYKSGRKSSYYAEHMMEGTDLQLRLYLLVLEQFWGITPVGALYLGFGDGVRRGAMRADFATRFAGVDPKAVKLLAPEDWKGFVDETPSLIAPLVDRLVRLDITPAPRDHDCGFCGLTPICRYDRWASEVR